MPRPVIGPKVDFRIPEEVEMQVREWADEDGVKHDAKFRDLLIMGFNRERTKRRTRPQSGVGAGLGVARTAGVMGRAE